MHAPLRRLALAGAVATVAALGLAPGALAIPPPCKGDVTSAIANHGYTPGKLAAAAGTTADAINAQIQTQCNAGTPAPQVAAQVLKDNGVAVAPIGSFLHDAFALTA